MLAVKYSDGSFYPVWWIVDVLYDTPIPPVGYVSMTDAEFDLWNIAFQSAMDSWLLENVTIPNAKQEVYSIIDKNTNKLINDGMTFDGYIFSMSVNAQINWSNFPNIPDQMFPLPVMDIYEDLYMVSLANKMNFYFTALNAKNTQLQSGSVLKGQVKVMTTLIEVESFVDPRMV